MWWGSHTEFRNVFTNLQLTDEQALLAKEDIVKSERLRVCYNSIGKV